MTPNYTTYGFSNDWCRWEDLTVHSDTGEIATDCFLQLSPTTVKGEGRFYCINANPSMYRITAPRAQGIAGGATKKYRREFLRQMRWWWKVKQQFAISSPFKTAQRIARRDIRHIQRHADHKLMNELTGYYGKRRRGHSYAHRQVWKFWVKPSVNMHMFPSERRIGRYVARAASYAVHPHVLNVLAYHGLGLYTMTNEERENTIWHFTNGLCYKLFLLLRRSFPEAEPWYDPVVGHVYTRIGPRWYDIRGERRERGNLIPLDHRRGHKPHRWKPYSDMGPHGKAPPVYKHPSSWNPTKKLRLLMESL